MRVAFLGDVFTADSTRGPTVHSEIKNTLGKCDEVVCNLEAPITRRNEPIPKKGPVMRHKASAVRELFSDLSVSVATLANNHIADHGVGGVADTAEALSSWGVPHCGAGSDFEATYCYHVVSDGKTRVAILSGGENGFGCVSAEYEATGGYTWLFHPKFVQLQIEAKQLNDFVVVVAHGGVEHMDHPLPQWRTAYKRCIDLGADAVVAHHPHLTQGIEIYRNAPIFYSIGNFFFNAVRPHEHWYHSQVPMLAFEKSQAVQYSIMHTRFTVSDSPTIEPDYSEWGEKRTRALSAELVDVNRSEYLKGVHRDLEALWTSRFAPGFLRSILALRGSNPKRLFATIVRAVLGRLSVRDYMLLEHFMEIESHRWAITEIMRLKRERPE